MKVFVVEALRWGDRENHSYVVGVFDNEEMANRVASAETAWRGGKYECVVTSGLLNTYSEEKLSWGEQCE